MKKHLWFFVALLLCGLLLAEAAAPTVNDAKPAKATSSRQSTPGMEAAQAISTITGVAISPLLGVSAVGGWKYWKTPPEKRSQLPWFAQPYFWVTGLALVLLVFLKDALGTALPASLKKPFDVLEVFENKVSALIATGAFVPLIIMLFGSAGGEDSAFAASSSLLAMVDLSPVLHALTIPFAMAVFLMVWVVSHTINVLILVSPFGVVDAALKSARLFVLSLLTAAAMFNPYLGAAFSILIIIACYFLSGWAFRMTVFGTVFAWDLLTMGQRRFKPDPLVNWVFTAQPIEKVPVRTYGKLTRGAQGEFLLNYRPWLVLPKQVLVLPAGEYAVGRGLIYPELLRKDQESTRTIFDLPPRYRTHEREVAETYKLGEVQDTGVIKGFKAVWAWLKELMGFGFKKPVQA